MDNPRVIYDEEIGMFVEIYDECRHQWIETTRHETMDGMTVYQRCIKCGETGYYVEDDSIERS